VKRHATDETEGTEHHAGETEGSGAAYRKLFKLADDSAACRVLRHHDSEHQKEVGKTRYGKRFHKRLQRFGMVNEKDNCQHREKSFSEKEHNSEAVGQNRAVDHG